MMLDDDHHPESSNIMNLVGPSENPDYRNEFIPLLSMIRLKRLRLI